MDAGVSFRGHRAWMWTVKWMCTWRAAAQIKPRGVLAEPLCLVPCPPHFSHPASLGPSHRTNGSCPRAFAQRASPTPATPDSVNFVLSQLLFLSEITRVTCCFLLPSTPESQPHEAGSAHSRPGTQWKQLRNWHERRRTCRGVSVPSQPLGTGKSQAFSSWDAHPSPAGNRTPATSSPASLGSVGHGERQSSHAHSPRGRERGAPASDVSLPAVCSLATCASSVEKRLLSSLPTF